MFRAGLCNRLDRNTSGLILAGKTVAATQQLSELIAERAVGKYYLTVVKGTVTETERIRGYLIKMRGQTVFRFRESSREMLFT